MGYQLLGEEENFLVQGETVLFKRGSPHRFWNAGDSDLQLESWVKPANNLIFFLSSIYEAQNKSGKGEPDKFDSAYLMTRYKSEFDMPGIPAFVKKIIIPIIYFLGKLSGRYKKFKNAPTPLI